MAAALATVARCAEWLFHSCLMGFNYDAIYSIFAHHILCLLFARRKSFFPIRNDTPFYCSSVVLFQKLRNACAFGISSLMGRCEEVFIKKRRKYSCFHSAVKCKKPDRQQPPAALSSTFNVVRLLSEFPCGRTCRAISRHPLFMLRLWTETGQRFVGGNSCGRNINSFDLNLILHIAHLFKTLKSQRSQR